MDSPATEQGETSVRCVPAVKRVPCPAAWPRLVFAAGCV
eukprot:COSAG01_NODE_11671_length_1883_cov_4.470852_4_plen_38_part_01